MHMMHQQAQTIPRNIYKLIHYRFKLLTALKRRWFIVTETILVLCAALAAGPSHADLRDPTKRPLTKPVAAAVRVFETTPSSPPPILSEVS